MRLPHAPKSGFGQFNHPVLMEDEIQARDIGEIIAAVIVGNLGACFDVLDGAYDDLVAYPMGLGIRPARMIYVTSEVLSARSVDRPTAVDLVEIAVASGLKFIGLLGRKLAAFVLDNE